MPLSTMQKRSIVRLDEAARVVTCSTSFRELLAGCRPHTSYTPTLRTNAYARSPLGELYIRRLRRALHRCGAPVYPTYGSLRAERDSIVALAGLALGGAS